MNTAANENSLALAHMKHARALAAQLKDQAERSMHDFDDLVQEGMIGFVRAIRRYDPAGGASLSTYAKRRMFGAMLDALKDTRRVKRVPPADMISLEEAFAVAGEDGRDWCEQMFNRQILDFIKSSIDALPPVQREVIDCLYFQDMKGCELAIACNVSEMTISKRRKSALTSLRKQVLRLIN